MVIGAAHPLIAPVEMAKESGQHSRRAPDIRDGFVDPLSSAHNHAEGGDGAESAHPLPSLLQRQPELEIRVDGGGVLLEVLQAEIEATRVDVDVLNDEPLSSGGGGAEETHNLGLVDFRAEGKLIHLEKEERS